MPKRTKPSTYLLLGIVIGQAYTHLWPGSFWGPGPVVPIIAMIVGFVGYGICFFKDPD